MNGVGDVTFKFDETGLRGAREAFAFGMLNMVYWGENEAKRNAPVDTGNLRRSIHSIVYSDGQVVGVDTDRPLPPYAPGSGVVGYIGTNCGYGVYQELGTRFMDAHPFLRPALDRMWERRNSLIEAGFKRHSR